jgi:hypothetical protein
MASQAFDGVDRRHFKRELSKNTRLFVLPAEAKAVLSSRERHALSFISTKDVLCTPCVIIGSLDGRR